MKLTILYLFLIMSISSTTAQTFPSALQAPQAPNLRELRQMEQARIDQDNAEVMRQHAAIAQNNQVEEAKEDLKHGEKQAQPINYEFPEIQAHSKQYFKQTLSEIQSMFGNKQDLSLKRAVFLAENAFMDNSMSYAWFSSEIASQIDILESFMKKEGLALNDDIAKKYMLQRLFSDTLTMRDDKGNYQFTHYPFKYDFDDPFGKHDWRKMFVTKLLSDKKGQCHSLPLLYLILAEEWVVKAWLSYSPQHSYIKTQDNKGIWYNFETTNGHYSTDSWLLSSGYVKAEAMKNKIFMDTLSRRETIAACLIDLANAYTQKFGLDKFVLTCAEEALKQSPRNIFALQTKADYYTLLFQYVVKQLHYPPKEQLHNYPEAYSLLQKAQELYALVDKSGYEDMPESVYQLWLESFEKEKTKQPIKIIKP